MSLGKRVDKLEESISKTHVDLRAEAELVGWLKSHSKYYVFAQPEHNDGAVMPECLLSAFACRVNMLCAERNLPPCLCSLVNVSDGLRRHYPHWSGG